MPWRGKSMKGVASCDKQGVGANNRLIPRCPNGETHVRSCSRITQMNQIVFVRITWGTETSKYPKEEKSNEIALVVASERAKAQTAMV